MMREVNKDLDEIGNLNFIRRPHLPKANIQGPTPDYLSAIGNKLKGVV